MCGVGLGDRAGLGVAVGIVQHSTARGGGWVGVWGGGGWIQRQGERYVGGGVVGRGGRSE